jgi:hypothetical protein
VFAEKKKEQQMQLKQSQKTALKTHMTANTNSTPATDLNGNALINPFVINTGMDSNNPDKEAAIAAWYNGAAKSGDNQPFTNRNVWNPFTTLRQVSSALIWATPPVGATAADVTNSWLLWQSMTWSATSQDSIALDMSDAQVRKGVYTVWGDVASGNASKIGGNNCGQKVGTNLELVCSGVVTGASPGGALTDAHPVQTDTFGASIVGQLLTQATVHDILLNG